MSDATAVTDDIDELEELEEVDEVDETPAPAPKRTRKAKTNAEGEAAPAKPKVEKPTFGTSELAAHVSKEVGKTYDNKGIRVLLRKMAKDGVLERTIGEDRSRYSFTGADDPQVAKIIAAIKSGEIEKAKAAELAKLEADKKTKAAAAAKAAPAEEETAAPVAKKTRTKKAPAPVVEVEEDDEVEELDEE